MATYTMVTYTMASYSSVALSAFEIQTWVSVPSRSWWSHYGNVTPPLPTSHWTRGRYTMINADIHHLSAIFYMNICIYSSLEAFVYHTNHFKTRLFYYGIIKSCKNIWPLQLHIWYMELCERMYKYCDGFVAVVPSLRLQIDWGSSGFDVWWFLWSKPSNLRLFPADRGFVTRWVISAESNGCH